MTGQHSQKKKHDLVHLLLPTVITLSQVFLPERAETANISTVLIYCFYVHAGTYLTFSYKRVTAHQIRIRNSFSQIEHIHLNWLKRLIAIFVLALVGDFLLAISVYYQLIKFGPAVGLIVLLESMTIFAIGYFSLQQPEILFPQTTSPQGRKKKYDNSALDASLSEQLASQLITLMQTMQPYKRNDLKLNDLAELMNLSSHHLSQIINEQMDCNFYEFINQYRIEYAESLMRSGEQINITRLAFDAGFNNRVSFTNAFKKQTHLTPSAYLKEHALKQAS